MILIADLIILKSISNLYYTKRLSFISNKA